MVLQHAALLKLLTHPPTHRLVDGHGVMVLYRCDPECCYLVYMMVGYHTLKPIDVKKGGDIVGMYYTIKQKQKNEINSLIVLGWVRVLGKHTIYLYSPIENKW